jgi:hypothetical protein
VSDFPRFSQFCIKSGKNFPTFVSNLGKSIKVGKSRKKSEKSENTAGAKAEQKHSPNSSRYKMYEVQ